VVSDSPTPDAILAAASGRLRDVVVLGIDRDGQDWIRSSTGDVGAILYLLELAKVRTMASVVLTPAAD
jgi:hypothetical protein